jgi:predicted nucleic acid-binding protein
MNAVDTNILVYAQDPRDPDKQAVARELIDDLEDGILLWQVACEFLAASRKLIPVGYTLDDAFEELRVIRSMWTFKLPHPAVMDRAEDLISRFSLSTWDALLIAASLEAGAQKLYSEDFTGYPNIDGMDIVNPFATP